MTTAIRLLTKAGRLTAKYVRAGLRRTLLKIGWRASRKLRWLLTASLLMLMVCFIISLSSSPTLPYITNPYRYPRFSGGLRHTGRDGRKSVVNEKLQKLHLEERDNERGKKVHVFAFKPDPGNQERRSMMSSSATPRAKHLPDPAEEVEESKGQGRLMGQPHPPQPHPPQDPAEVKMAGKGSREFAPLVEAVDMTKRQSQGHPPSEDVHEEGTRINRGSGRPGELEEDSQKMPSLLGRPGAPEHLGEAAKMLGKRPQGPTLRENAGEEVGRQTERPVPIEQLRKTVKEARETLNQVLKADDMIGKWPHAPVPPKRSFQTGELWRKPPQNLAPVGDFGKVKETMERRPQKPLPPGDPSKASTVDERRPKRPEEDGDSGKKMGPQFHLPPENPASARRMTGKRSQRPQDDNNVEQRMRIKPQRPNSLEDPGKSPKIFGPQRPPRVEDSGKPKQVIARRPQVPENGEKGGTKFGPRSQKPRPPEDPVGQVMREPAPRREDGDLGEGKVRRRPQRPRDPEDGDLGRHPSGHLPAEDAGSLDDPRGQGSFDAPPAVTRDDGLLYLLQGETRPPRPAPDSNQTQRQCSPHLHVFFAKVHKTGSSTIANILQRFGFTHHLNFVLPRKRMHSASYNYLSLPGQTLTRHDLIPPPRGEEYHVLWNHAIYDRNFFRELMPKDTFYVSVLRHPLSQFVSTLQYYSRALGDRINEFMHMNASNPLSVYLQNPSQFAWLGGNLSFVRNKQAQDLGMNMTHLNNATLRQEYLQQLGKDFHWVFITEFFDESLVMLKRLLCWDIKDILYIPKNKNPFKKKYKFTPEERESHKNLDVADYELYNFFSKRMKNTLKAQPPDFYDEVTYFKALVEAVQWHCARGAKESTMVVVKSEWNPQFAVENKDCRMMQKHELVFMDILFVDAVRRYQKSIQRERE